MIEDIKSSFNNGSILTKLIYINVGVFLPIWFLELMFPAIYNWVALPGTFNNLIFKPWTAITYMFIHSTFLHLLMNMLWLFWLGTMFLDYFQPKQLAAVYILGGLSGAVLHLFANSFTYANSSMVGASAAVMTIVFAVVMYKPERIIHLLFIGPVKMKYVGLVIFILDLMGLASNIKGAGTGVAHLAHMGGSLYGLWFGYSMRNNKDITRSFVKFMDNIVIFFSGNSHKTKRNKMKVTKNTNRFEKPKSDWEHNKAKSDNQDEINRILDKISNSGYNSLSKKEKQFLFKQKDK